MNKQQNSWTVEVQANQDDYYIELPDDLLKQVGWDVDDVIVWEAQDNGSYVLSKKEEEKIYIVETITITKHAYAVKGKCAEHALDSVVMGDVEEFGQKYIDENVVSTHELKNQEEYFKWFDNYNHSENLPGYPESFKVEQIHVIQY